MNWEAIGAICEAIGGAGVIISLIYLALQIKQSKDATQAATVDQITGKFIDWMYTNSRVPGFRRFFRDGLPSLVEASDDEVMEFFGAVQALFKIMESIQFQRHKGLINDNVWNGWDAWFGNMKSYDAVQYFYRQKSQNLSSTFCTYWDNLEEKPDGSLVSIVQSLRKESLG